MFITRECDYAVRVIRALAGEARLSVSEICEKEMITAPFAYKILKKLQKAKIVKGYRGVHGGYSLNEDVSQLTLYDVYLLLIRKCLLSNACIRAIPVSGMEKEGIPVQSIRSWKRSRVKCGNCCRGKI